MAKLQRPVGLIRYDSLNGLEKKPKKILRPRIYLYAVLLVIGAFVATYTLSQRTSFEANLIRLMGSPYILESGNIRNQFEIHMMNKSIKPRKFLIQIQSSQPTTIILPISEVEMESRADKHIPWMALVPQNQFQGSFDLSVTIQDVITHELLQRKVQFLGPK